MDTNAEIAKAALKPGAETTEFAAKQSTSWWAKVVMGAGMITAIVPQVVSALQQTGADQQKWGMTTLTVLGVLMGIAGVIANGSVNNSYINSRGLVKAAAVRDVDLN